MIGQWDKFAPIRRLITSNQLREVVGKDPDVEGSARFRMARLGRQ